MNLHALVLFAHVVGALLFITACCTSSASFPAISGWTHSHEPPPQQTRTRLTLRRPGRLPAGQRDRPSRCRTGGSRGGQLPCG